MKKKKILFVIDTLKCGGAEKSLTSLLNAFNYDKYDVKLQLHTIEGCFLKSLPEEVEILPELPFVNYCKLTLIDKLKKCDYNFLLKRIYLAFGIFIERIRKKISSSQAYWKYAQYAFKTNKETFDVAIAWGQRFPTYYVASKVSARKKFTILNAEYISLNSDRDFDLNYYEKFLKIMTVSENLKLLTAEIFPEFKNKLFTLYDFNNAELIQHLSESENPFINENCIKIVTVGRLAIQKGYDILVDAAKILKNININFKWFIIGEGKQRGFLEENIEKYNLKDNVFLLGEKENPYPYMKNADVYVQTSRNEGFCLTLTEAKILNTPIVSTNFDTVYNQIEHKKNGLIAEKNALSVSNAIIEIISHDTLRKNIIKNLSIEKKGNIEEVYKLYQYIEE